MFRVRCIATSKAWTYREHCFYCCVFFGMCLLGRRLAMNAPLLLDASWLEHVYRVIVWQSVDQIRYNIELHLEIRLDPVKVCPIH
jgi:hypothetical protein